MGTDVLIPTSSGAGGTAFISNSGASIANLFNNILITGPSGFGTGGPNTSGTPLGDTFGFIFTGTDSLNPRLVVPNNYSSGDSISGSLTFNGATFASLGVDDSQTFVWTLDANNDTVTLQFGEEQPQTTPESSALLGLLAFGGLGLLSRKKKQS
ncbi:MAG: LPXTG cell wall anchor domain-containing protein [Crocosphaera sp.]